MTSMGVTTATASVIPAASPAERSDQNLDGRNERNERGKEQLYQRRWPGR